MSDDNADTSQIVGDTADDFSSIEKRTSVYFHELKGHLYSNGYYRPGTGWVLTDWLTHYTGDAEHSFEVAKDTARDFHSSLNFSGAFYVINEMLEIGGSKGIARIGSSDVIRFKFTTVTGRNGDYPRPDGETVISTTAKDIYRKNGIGYLLESSGGTTTVRWSSDLITWNTLFTCTTGTTPVYAMAIANGDVWFTGGVNLYRVPGPAFGGLPTGFNTAPVATGESYATDFGVPIALSAGSKGVLPNDTDGNGDKLKASVATAPASGNLALEGNGRFTYTPNPGFSGNDSFVYSASDGIASANADGSVTLTLRYPKSTPSATVTMEWTASLLPGSWSSTGVTAETPDTATGLYSRSFTAPPGSSPMFVRLKTQ